MGVGAMEDDVTNLSALDLKSDYALLLMEAVTLIGSFRHKLRAAGYPFREPPGVDALIHKADRTLYPAQHKTTQR